MLSVNNYDRELGHSSDSFGTKNPFVGPRAFRESESDLFFGRDEEVDNILALISAHRLVLIIAPSGVGKTSIFNAKVVPELKNDGFEVLPMTRVGVSTFSDVLVGTETNDGNATLNPYILNAVWGMKPDVDPILLANMSLSNFLYYYFPNKISEKDEIIPQVLILDQLEEIFSFHPEWHKQRHGFFKQVAQALDYNTSLRIVFIMREEYSPQLDPFENDLPEKLRVRFRFGRLKSEAALEAIRGALSSTKEYFEPDRLHKLEGEAVGLVKDLMQISVEDSTGSTHQEEGEFIEPIHLQVVCQKWWNARMLKNNAKKRGHLGGHTDVDTALAEFYCDVIHYASLKTGVPETSIRNWCGSKLITSTDIRSTVHRGPQHTEGIENGVLDALDEKYLIRGEWRAGGRWYELIHDRLIKPIKKSNFEKVEADRQKKRKKILKYGIPSIATAIVIVGIVISYIIASISGSVNLPPVDQIGVGQAPNSADLNPKTRLLYVTNGISDSVSIIDGRKNEIVSSELVGNRPVGVAVNSATNFVYVTNSLSDSVSVIDVNSNKVVSTIPVGRTPLGVAVNPDTNRIYVANADSNTVSVIDGNSTKVVSNITVGIGPLGVAVNPNTNFVYVTNYLSNRSVSVIDGNAGKIISEINVTNGPFGVAVNPNTNFVYVTNYLSDTVSIIDASTNRVTAVTQVGNGPTDMAIDPRTDSIYVANFFSGTLSVIDGQTNKVAQNLSSQAVDRRINGVDINLSSEKIYFTDPGFLDPPPQGTTAGLLRTRSL